MNRFVVQLSNYDDLFINAELSGSEVDLVSRLETCLLERHGRAVEGLRVLRAYRVS